MDINKIIMESIKASDRVIPKHSPYSVDPEEGPPAHASHSVDPEPNKTEYVPKDYSPPTTGGWLDDLTKTTGKIKETLSQQGSALTTSVAKHMENARKERAAIEPKRVQDLVNKRAENAHKESEGTAGQYFTKAFKNLKQKSEEQASILGHNVARKLEDVDPKLAVAGAAIAAGLGALALRKKLQNSK